MPQRSIRFSEKLAKEIAAVSRDRGFSSEAAFIRYAVSQEVTFREEELVGAEERLAATIEQARKEIFRLRREHQALFAYVDTLTKTLLTCLPEPPGDAKPQAIARARERHYRLLKTAGQSMVGDSRLAMHDLIAPLEDRSTREMD
jgi:Arc/MetJ-type ribon-helix-helix transcriptional regulator